MPHYADGTLAKVGDLVRGKGYNVKGLDGQLREISGVVTHVRPGENKAGGCTLTVAYLEPVAGADNRYADGLTRFHGANVVADGLPLKVATESGDTVGFTKIG